MKREGEPLSEFSTDTILDDGEKISNKARRKQSDNVEEDNICCEAH